MAAASPRAVPGEARRDQRVVVRPDGAVVVLDRVVGGSPSADIVRTPQPENSGADPAGAATVARGMVGRRMPLHSRWPMLEVRVDGPLVAVERQRVEAALGQPEVALEARPQLLGLGARAAGQRRRRPQTSRGQPRAAPLRVVGVALDLAGRDRRLGEPAVGEDDRVPGVLPALVARGPFSRLRRLVLDVAVAVEVAVASIHSSAARALGSSSPTARGRRSTARTRRARRGTAASSRRCRSTASAAARRSGSARRGASRAGSCPARRRGSRRAGRLVGGQGAQGGRGPARARTGSAW